MLSKKKLLTIIEHLEGTIRNLQLKTKQGEWDTYISNNPYSEDAQKEKSRIISHWLQSIKPKTIWDAGCNTGYYSLLATKFCDYVIALDADFLCIEHFYAALMNSKTRTILPLVADLSNPTPGAGWKNHERKTLTQRGNPNLIMALALIHHLRITHGVPLTEIAKLFSELGEWLIIEFVPKEDAMVQGMLAHRKDIFEDYTPHSFLSTFEFFFSITASEHITGSDRIVYLMKRKTTAP